MQRSRVINSVGLAMTATVLVVVLVTKFLLGAWIAILAMVGLFVLMRAIRTHYDHVSAELDLSQIDPAKARALPSRVHAIVLVSKVHLPTMRALAYARAARASTLEAITVDVDPEATEALRKRWEELDLPVPLKALHSPYREITRPILRYVKRIRRAQPARPGRRVRAGVRGGPLVGAGAAQPERAAAEVGPALHARRGRRERAVAAAVLDRRRAADGRPAGRRRAR